jgi:hypothetical protein
MPSEMRKYGTQNFKWRQDSVTRVRDIDKIRHANFNFLFHPAKFYRKSSNKSNKMVEKICTYLMIFFETSSIHGFKYLTPKNRATSER